MLAATSLAPLQAGALFDAPVYFRMGGPERTDSRGRTWRGDTGAGQDLFNIRPDDLGGMNVIEDWCTPSAASLQALGFDPSAAADVDILRSIRWDPAGDGHDYVLEVPVAAGSYSVELYFCEACCPQRHFKAFVQGALAAADVHVGSYAGGQLHAAGRLRLDDVTVGANERLNITLLSCPDPECPGGADGNAILSALAIIPSGFDPCTDPAFGRCPTDLSCSVGPDGTVTGTWTAPRCRTPAGYELYRNGQFLGNPGAMETTFTDTIFDRAAFYELVPFFSESGGLPAPDPACALSCQAVRPDAPFAVPVRLNMGGPPLYDSLGRLWLGDGPGPGDPLSIRPNDAGGANTILEWCPTLSRANESMAVFGLDPRAASDQAIFNTIRWDLADDDGDGFPGELFDPDGGDVDFHLEVPVPDGEYLVNLYVTECCCSSRHFQVELQGALVDSDVSVVDYSASREIGRTGRLTFGPALVFDRTLRLSLRPCPACAAPPVDTNAIVDAIEVLPAASLNPVCPRDLICTLNPDGTVSGSWTPGAAVEIKGYQLLRNSELVATLEETATSFTDDPGCVRHVRYEVLPLSDGFLCQGLRLGCSVLQLDCPFASPVRINMGGPGLTDSLGRFWVGDPGLDLDTLSIRPDDNGGSNAIVDWEIQNLQPDSLAQLGFDPDDPVDRSLLSTIRWDTAADGIDYRLEVPLANGLYRVCLYLSENFWNPPELRAFKLEVQGTVVDTAVSALDFSPERPETGRAGKLTFDDVLVADGFLRLGLLPCDLVGECPGIADSNPILSLLEVIQTDTLNHAPTAVISALPGTAVTLMTGSAEVTLDGSGSDDGDGGTQGLSYAWSKLSGPAGDAIESPAAASTQVTFTATGVYRYRLDVDDGQPEDNTASAEVEITVLPELAARFVRADADSNGDIELTDGIRLLGFLFLGMAPPACADAADADDNGALEISDAIRIFGWLFSGGQPPARPAPSAAQDYSAADCGLDLTAGDPLDCEMTSRTCL
jgi:hypothetical protein